MNDFRCIRIEWLHFHHFNLVLSADDRPHFAHRFIHEQHERNRKRESENLILPKIFILKFDYCNNGNAIGHGSYSCCNWSFKRRIEFSVVTRTIQMNRRRYVCHVDVGEHEFIRLLAVCGRIIPPQYESRTCTTLTTTMANPKLQYRGKYHKIAGR